MHHSAAGISSSMLEGAFTYLSLLIQHC